MAAAKAPFKKPLAPPRGSEKQWFTSPSGKNRAEARKARITLVNNAFSKYRKTGLTKLTVAEKYQLVRAGVLGVKETPPKSKRATNFFPIIHNSAAGELGKRQAWLIGLANGQRHSNRQLPPDDIGNRK